MSQRKKRNSSKVNLTISAIFHSLLILAVFFFAAREGMLGKKLKEITVTMVPKEKKPEPPKPKPAEPKVEQPKVAEQPKPAVPQPKVETAAAPPPALNPAGPAVAPAEVNLPSFQFSDGAHAVQTVSDPVEIYKSLVESVVHSHWHRPDDIDDDTFVAEAQLNIDSEGNVQGYRWVKGSGNTRWDAAAKQALADTRSINRPPPKGFPDAFVVRFDVVTEPVENTFQLSSR